MKTWYFFLALTWIAISEPACKKDGAADTGCPAGVPATFRNLTGLDGCGFVLELDNGTRLEIANPNDLAVAPVEGLKVAVEYTNRPDLASVCMVGPIVQVNCIAHFKK